MTAASAVELWISSDSDPFSISKVMELVYDDMVRAEVELVLRVKPHTKSGHGNYYGNFGCAANGLMCGLYSPVEPALKPNFRWTVQVA